MLAHQVAYRAITDKHTKHVQFIQHSLLQHLHNQLALHPSSFTKLFIKLASRRNRAHVWLPKGPSNMPVDIQTFLAEEREKADADVMPMFLTFEDYWERRLWHQLTDTLLEFFRDPQSAPHRLPVYNTFVLTFADKINQLNLVTLGLSSAGQIQDNQEALNFLTELQGRVKDKSQEAYVYASVESARMKLHLQDFEGARKILDESEKILDNFDSVESVVHASFYRVNADYYNTKLEFASYYKNALLYLACINIDDLSLEERRVRAYNLSVAALVSDSIYNFGELLLHPILNSLHGTKNEWLRDMLFAYNSGNIAKYNGLSGHLSKEPVLSEQADFLSQKICLSALTEAVFRRAPNDRALSFMTIMEETKVLPDGVEFLVMKALSLGLIRGSIDQVAEIARISWVQPKVLNLEQVESMRQRLMEWDSSVSNLSSWIEEQL